MKKNLRNEKGQDIQAFLEAYNPGHYDRPSVTLDIAIMTPEQKILMIRRKNHPNIGRWGLPGGFLEMEESLYDGALRELKEETSVSNVELFPLGMFGAVHRDPRTRIITAAFAALMPENELSIRAGDDAADAKLFSFFCEKKGMVAIPSISHHYPDIELPCTAYGQRLPENAEGYALFLESDALKLSAEFAIDKGEIILLKTPYRAEDEPIAGDHALIIATAILRCFPALLA